MKIDENDEKGDDIIHDLRMLTNDQVFQFHDVGYSMI